MKKHKSENIRVEYKREDLGRGVRGKYLKAYAAGSNVVMLSAENAAAFPTSKAVNEALQGILEAKRE